MTGFIALAGFILVAVNTLIAGVIIVGLAGGADNLPQVVDLALQWFPGLDQQHLVFGTVGLVWLFFSVPGFLLMAVSTAAGVRGRMERRLTDLTKQSTQLEELKREAQQTNDLLRDLLDRRGL